MRQYQKLVFGNITKKSISAFSSENTGSYLSILTNDATTIKTNYLNGSIQIITNLLWAVLSLALMFYYNWSLTLVALASISLPIIVSLLFGNKLAAEERKISDSNEGFVGLIKDILSGFPVIKSFKAEREVQKRFAKATDTVEQIKLTRGKTEQLITIVSSSAGFLAQFGIFIYGAYLALNDQTTIGIVFAFVELMNFILTPVRQLPTLFAQRKAAIALIDKAADLVTKNTASDKTEHIGGIGDGIHVSNLSFCYEEDEPVLKDLSLSFEQGKSYAIVGASGSGKTTLLNLLMGSYDNYGGSITIDGKELRTVAPESLYDTLSIVQQSVFIFDSSIRDNITLFKEFPADKIDSAVSRAGLTPLLAERGEDYDCGENGSGLSGGERQRVSIARGLLRETPVLLMDEATAALDAATAHDVTDAVLSIKDLTRIVVTHKLDESTLSRYDRILAIRNGTLCEQGSFEELM